MSVCWKVRSTWKTTLIRWLQSTEDGRLLSCGLLRTTAKGKKQPSETEG